MANSEIKITFNDSGVNVQAEIRKGLKPSCLFEGLLAYASTVAQILETDEASIIAFRQCFLRNGRKIPKRYRKKALKSKSLKV